MYPASAAVMGLEKLTFYFSFSNFRLQNTKLEDLSYLLAGVNTSIKRPTARLQIVIICPLFVEKIRIAALQDYCFSKILHPDKVLAMMLGVQDDDDNNHMKTGRLFFSITVINNVVEYLLRYPHIV